MTPDETRRVLQRLTGGFDHRLGDDTYEIWAEELADLDFSPAYAAATALVRGSKFFPKIAEFRMAYGPHHRAQTPHREPCRHCDEGWVGHDTLVACSACRPTTFARQMDGGYQPTKRGEWEPHDADEIAVARAHLEGAKALLPVMRGQLAPHAPPTKETQ